MKLTSHVESLEFARNPAPRSKTTINRVIVSCAGTDFGTRAPIIIPKALPQRQMIVRMPHHSQNPLTVI